MSQAAPLDIPRWEWRIFAPSFDEVKRLHSLSPKARAVQAEISILCQKSMHDVLIQGGTIRLKWRKQIGPGGLELWDSILRSPFPCPAGIVLRLFEALGMPAPQLPRAHYSQRQFLTEILPQNSDLNAVPIRKQSEVFLLDGATCEWAELSTDRCKVESLCIEHEDPGLALQVVRHLGLQSRPNTSHPQGLKTSLYSSLQP